MWGDDAGGGMGLNDGLNDNLLDGGEDARDSMLAYDNNGVGHAVFVPDNHERTFSDQFALVARTHGLAPPIRLAAHISGGSPNTHEYDAPMNWVMQN